MEGEWADALYDYSSEVNVGFLGKNSVERVVFISIAGPRRSRNTSRPESAGHGADVSGLVRSFSTLSVPSFNHDLCRWTGEFDGKKGLFPASYVKIL